MTELQVSPEQLPPREPLSDERLGELLASVGNQEGKALLLIAMANGPEDKTYGRAELRGLLRSLPGAENAYLGNEGNQIDWCNVSLAPIGLVARSDYSRNLTFGVTPVGKGTGKALAGFMLDFADRHDIALLDLMGTTHTRGETRSPETRFRIARGLLKFEDPLSLQEVANITGGSSKGSVTHQLSALNIRGLWRYEAKNRNTEVPSFFLQDKDYTPKPGKVFTPLIVEALRANEKATIEEVLQYAMQATPAGSIGIDEKTYRARIHTGIYALKRRGIIGALNLREMGTHGKVSLTDEQRAFWSELIDGLERIQSQEAGALNEYGALADLFTRNPDRVNRALSRAAEASILAQNGTEKRVDVLVENALQRSIGFVSVKDIVERITIEHGRTLSQESVRMTLRALLANGRVHSKPGSQKPVYELIQDTTLTD